MADQDYLDPVTGKPMLPPQTSSGDYIDVSAPKVLPPGTPMAAPGPGGIVGASGPGGGAPDEIDASELAPPVHPVVQEKMKQLEQQPQAKAAPPDEIDASEVKPGATGKALYAPQILAEAEKQGLTPAQGQILVGIAQHESGFDPGAKGPADPHTGHHAQGMFQQFPASVQDSHGDLSTPEGQIASGTAYFKQMLAKANGDPALAAGLYNAGPNAPDKINPAYIKAVYAASGAQLPDNFRPLAQRVYSLAHAAQGTTQDGEVTQDSGADAPWSFPANTLNDMTLGAGKLAADHLHAAMYGTSPEQESALSQMYQERWADQAGVVPRFASAAMGFMAPDAAIAKGVMAGGRVLAQAAPAIGPVVSRVLGLAGSSVNPIKAFGASTARAVAGGAAFGAIDSGADQSKSMGDQAAQGAFGGALGALASPVLGAVGKGFGSLVDAARDDDAPLLRRAQEKMGQMLGPNAPPLVESTTPGMNYSLPEALDGKTRDLAASWFSKVSKGTPELEAKIRNDAAARADRMTTLGGTMQDWQNAKASRDALGDQIGTIFNSSKQKLDLSGPLKTLRELAADPRRNKSEGFPEAMKELEARFYKPAEPISRSKPVGTMEDLKSALTPANDDFEHSLYQQLEAGSAVKAAKPPAPKLEDMPAPIHGIRKYIQGQLDTKDTPVNHMDKNIKDALVQVKDEIDEALNQVPEAREANQRYAAAAKREDELKYVQGKNLTNYRGNPTIPALQRMIKEIDQAPMKPGVLGQLGRAKSVSQEMRDGYQSLLEDLLRTDRAKISTAVSGHAADGAGQGEHGKIIPGLMHASAGTTGAFGAHLAKLPLALGWAGGITASMASKMVGAVANKAQRAAELKVLLDPKKYPPIQPKAQELPPGFYSGVVGGQGYQGMVGPDHQEGRSQQKIVMHDTAEAPGGDLGAPVKAGDLSGGEDYPSTRSFPTGSFPQGAKAGGGLYNALQGKVGQPKPSELPDDLQSFLSMSDSYAKATGRLLSPERKQEIADEFEAARRSPLARLGFNLGHTLITPDGVGYGNDAGAYTPDKDMAIASLSGPKGTLVHESIHRGLQVLRNAGLMQGVEKAAQDNNGVFSAHRDELIAYHSSNNAASTSGVAGYDEEHIVRAIMHDTMGDPQGKETPDEYRGSAQGPSRGPGVNNIINQLNKAATTYMLQQRAKGTPVDYVPGKPMGPTYTDLSSLINAAKQKVSGPLRTHADGTIEYDPYQRLLGVR